uniref:PPPDE domain-containing protein n=1 Tax=Opuntia streptacantha TaxID=393608 RepID=A0A7C8ZD35_OPUST
MLCMKNPCVDVSGSVPVFLNVYDISPVNGYAYWFGLGVYHSGVQVHGVEYAFGAHEYPSTGIFEGVPKKCEGFTFRKGILIGWTESGPEDVKKVMEELAEKYRGNAYNLITKNCNHFCNDVCVRLTGNHIPSWVNRLARIGFLCNCVIPEKITMGKIGCQRKEEKVIKEVEDKKLGKSSPKRLTNSSNSASSSSSPPSDSATIGSKSTRSTS